MYGKGARVERVDIDNWPKKYKVMSIIVLNFLRSYATLLKIYR
jgi:hypothetical protein